MTVPLYLTSIARLGLLLGSGMLPRRISDLSRKLCCPGLFSSRRFSNGRSLETSQKNRHITITVEGNIGSGKSTFLDYFGKVGSIEVLHEPVDRWCDVKGHNALAMMYSEPTRWSLALQTYVQLTMLQQHLAPQDRPVRILERSIYSARYCFVENLHQRASLSALEYSILDEWFSWLVSTREINVDYIVYLQTKPEVVHRRVRARCREEETCVSLDYLQDLHDLHEDWLVRGKFPRPAPVLVIDANDDIAAMRRKYEECYNDLFQTCSCASSPMSRP